MRELRDILTENGFRFNKAYGQNFITDSNLLRAIVQDAGITAEDTVVEIGAGGGTLTRSLASAAKRVVSFEIDRNLEKVLSRTLADCPNAEVHYADFMKLDMAEINRMVGTSYKVVANLPYYITTPVIMRFLENDTPVISLTLMVQREVAERFTAKPGTAAYGAVTVAVDARGNARIVRTVNRQLFYPVPNVDSAVVRIDLADKFAIENFAFFQRVYKCAFAMRRKTLANNLMAGFGLNRLAAENIISEAGLAAGCRGETLATEELLRLADCLKKYF